ncbi:helix-turn-helix transcriptional regulator [Dactylosporangium sp. NPDC049742]|uniref:helix-turn-helix transcriptional regulator n=1 Tax=Dactylosporangium sp. NPDC049742 TaxID=3154737 RepID=UPI003447C5B9
MSQRIDPPAHPGETLGVLLTRLRQAQGKSQVRLAGLLCAASGLPTLTRHEISRWEREERIPSRVWLCWLALVLDTPLDDLERAAAHTRRRREPTMTTPTISTITATIRPVPRPPGPASAGASTDRVAPPGSVPHGPATHGTGPGTGMARPSEVDDVGGRIAGLRRMDDLVAGPELVALVLAGLRSAVRATGTGCGPPAAVAELVQLHAWVAADAGRPVPDGAVRGGVRAAVAGGDRALAGHLLGCVAQAAGERGDARAAVRAAVAAERVAGACDPATATVLALRTAFAAAAAGDRRSCDGALATAERAHARRGSVAEPPWLYWLDDAHVEALAGLCLTAAGRPAAALPRLGAALRDPGVRFRAAGLVSAALARAHLARGDLDAACTTAAETLLTCVESGSFRVLRQLRALETALHAAAGRGRRPAALVVYTELAESAAGCLPGAAPPPARQGHARAGSFAAPAVARTGGSDQLRGRVAS